VVPVKAAEHAGACNDERTEITGPRCSGQPIAKFVSSSKRSRLRLVRTSPIMEFMWAAMATSMVATASTLQTHHGHAAQSEAAGSHRPTTTTRVCPMHALATESSVVLHALCCSFEIERGPLSSSLHGPLLGSPCIVMQLMSILLSYAVCPPLTNTSTTTNVNVECLTTLQMNASLIRASCRRRQLATDLHAHNGPQAGCLHTCNARRDCLCANARMLARPDDRGLHPRRCGRT
jgi:hypothetical protein